MVFKNNESGKRIWEAGVVMARFLFEALVKEEGQEEEDEFMEIIKEKVF